MAKRFITPIESDVPNGTSPMIIDSSTLVSNLNADLLDGQHGSYYAPISSPEFTGIPVAPTAESGTNNTQIATTAFVQAAVAGGGGGGGSALHPMFIIGGV